MKYKNIHIVAIRNLNSHFVSYKVQLLAISIMSLIEILFNGIFPYVTISHTKTPKDL